MRRALSTLLVAAATAGAVVLATGASDGAAGRSYTLVFDQAFGLVEGADFKVAGVRVGQIETLRLSEGWPPRAEVDVVVDESGVRGLRRGAVCEIKPQSLIGEYFVDCAPGQGEEMPDGGVVPVEQTRPTIPLDVVATTMREPYRERFRIILMTLGAALAGRPEDLGELLQRAHPGLRETSETLRILGRQDEVIERFIASSDTVVAQLNDRREDIVRFIREAGETGEVAASRRDELARIWRLFPAFLAELDPTMERLGELADAQIPVLRNLERAGDDLTETFEELRPFADASQPALASLGTLSRVGRAAIRESRDEVAELRELAAEAPALARPLRRYLESLDDRGRSIETDLRAKETAPPPPDKTAYEAGQGFTGMESVLNYFYWQTLAINGFDQVSHVLRFTGIVNECSDWRANVEGVPDHCKSWLGPYQPGLTAPDPTEGGRPRTPEQDAAEGEDDPSQPPAGLPGPIQDMVDAIEPRGTSRAPQPQRSEGRTDVGPDLPEAADEQLLDFLFAP